MLVPPHPLAGVRRDLHREEGIDGATTLTALAEYDGDKVRRSLSLEKADLQAEIRSCP